MAAIAYPMVDPWVTARPARPARPGSPGHPARPGRPDGAVYRRRRAMALLALVPTLLMAAVALRLALAGPGGGALTTSGSSGAAASPPAPLVSAHVYVVQPGDTLWSIVRATTGKGDPRPEVDRLALQLDGRALQPGQRLLLP